MRVLPEHAEAVGELSATPTHPGVQELLSSVLTRVAPALDTAAHFAMLRGEYHEAQAFTNDALLVRAAAANARDLEQMAQEGRESMKTSGNIVTAGRLVRALSTGRVYEACPDIKSIWFVVQCPKTGCYADEWGAQLETIRHDVQIFDEVKAREVASVMGGELVAVAMGERPSVALAAKQASLSQFAELSQRRALSLEAWSALDPRCPVSTDSSGNVFCKRDFLDACDITHQAYVIYLVCNASSKSPSDVVGHGPAEPMDDDYIHDGFERERG